MEKKGVTMFGKIAKKMPCTEKFLRWILPRGLLIILGLAVCLVIIGNTPRVETGVVEYKLVTGKNDQTSHILLINMNRKNITVTERMRDILPSGYEDIPVNRALESEMHKYYTDIQYKVSLRLSRDNTIKSFIVPRDVFNAAETNSMIKFEIERPYSNKVTRVVTDDNTLASTAHYPVVNESRHFLHQ